MNPAQTYAALRVNGRRTGAAPAPDPGVPAGLTPQLVAQYVDNSGVLQSATADKDNTPSISGVAPFTVWFDASGSRSVSTDADDKAGAWNYMNYRFDSGEALGGTWSLTGEAKDVREGAPVCGHVFTAVGTHTFTLTVRDSEGRQGFITMTVDVTAPAAGTTITAGTSWPTWADGTVYNLNAGSDYTSMGTINLSGRRNILIRKTGSGADPIVGTIRLDTRDVVGTAASRTRACRTLNVNVNEIQESSIGSLYCGVIGGRLGSYEPASAQYYWENEATTQIEKNNICRTRGFAFWDCGEVNSNGTTYVYIGEGIHMMARNVDFNKTAGTDSAHVLRGWFNGFDLRCNRFRSAVDFMSYNKIQGADNGSTFDAWPEDDTYGVWNGAMYRPICRHVVLEHNIYGAVGSDNAAGTNIEVMPENNDAAADQALELHSIAHNRWYVSSWVGMNNSFDGRNIYYRDNKLNLGAGTETPYSFSSRTNRIPPGWEGPYVNTARPAFD